MIELKGAEVSRMLELLLEGEARWQQLSALRSERSVLEQLDGAMEAEQLEAEHVATLTRLGASLLDVYLRGGVEVQHVEAPLPVREEVGATVSAPDEVSALEEQVMPPSPALPLATLKQVDELRDKFLNGEGFCAEEEAAATRRQRAIKVLETSHELARRLVALMGDEVPLQSAGEVRGVLDALASCVAKEQDVLWQTLDNGDFLGVASLFAAHARVLQSEGGCGMSESALNKTVRVLFSQVHRLRQDRKQLFVHGLGMKQRPAHGETWRDDVRYWRARFVTPQEVVSEPVCAPEQVSPREVVSEPAAASSAQAEVTIEGPPPIAEDAVLVMTEGVCAVVCGGDKKLPHLDEIKAYFRFDGLVGVAVSKTKQGPVKRLEKQILQGKYGMVFLLKKFLSHHGTETLTAACKVRGVPCIVLGNGYGKSGFYEGLKRRYMIS